MISIAQVMGLAPVDTGRKLNVHKMFRRCLGRILNVLCMFNLRPVPTAVSHLFHQKTLKKLHYSMIQHIPF